MKPSDMMPIEHDQAQMCQLGADRRRVRMELPGLPIEGLPQPSKVKINFDAGAIDQMIERLLVLRAHELPARLSRASGTKGPHHLSSTSACESQSLRSC
jgi:hypothetical protein